MPEGHRGEDGAVCLVPRVRVLFDGVQQAQLLSEERQNVLEPSSGSTRRSAWKVAAVDDEVREDPSAVSAVQRPDAPVPHNDDVNSGLG